MSIPTSGITRSPDLWQSHVSLSHITRSQNAMSKVQEQLSTGKTVTRYSDDSVKAALINAINGRLTASSQVRRNLENATASLAVLDSSFKDASDLAIEARDIASTQLNVGSSATEREQQATVVDQMIASLLSISQRRSEAGYVLGGGIISSPPIQEFMGGYRYVGQGDGMLAELGSASTVPITLGGSTMLGGVSARMKGTVDLNPYLTSSTRLSDLNGARGLGIALGTIEFSVNGQSRVSLDLVGADTIDAVTRRVQAAIEAEATRQGTTVLGSGGVGVSGESISLDVASGAAVEFFDLVGATTAADLGLTNATGPITFSSTTPSGNSVSPRLTMTAPITSLGGVSSPLGSIRIKSMGYTTVVDLSNASTIEDVKNRIESTNLGLRVRINEAGNGIDIFNEVAGSAAQALSIENVSATDTTAQALGIRTFSAATRIADLNEGRGVSIVDGRVNPTTGQVDGNLNTDLVITLGDSASTALTIDLRPQDMLTVQSVIDRINAQAAPQLQAAGLPANAFVASINAATNGISFTQDSSFSTAPTVRSLNNSQAAEDLGLLDSTFDTATSTLLGEDRAKIRVDNLFSQLIDLRDALRRNDTSGISLAGEKLGDAAGALAETRGLVGSYSRRVEQADTFQQERDTLDESVRSTLQDTDFAAAATQFSLLQNQLTAALQVTAAGRQQSLLDFLS
jgi:flagellin-like hook-associated protein FlgL